MVAVDVVECGKRKEGEQAGGKSRFGEERRPQPARIFWKHLEEKEGSFSFLQEGRFNRLVSPYESAREGQQAVSAEAKHCTAGGEQD
jgi:hypothetical protein